LLDSSFPLPGIIYGLLLDHDTTVTPASSKSTTGAQR
jgi:hypothetical protein